MLQLCKVLSEWRASATFEIAFQWVALPASRSVATKIAGGKLSCRLTAYFKVKQVRLKTRIPQSCETVILKPDNKILSDENYSLHEVSF